MGTSGRFIGVFAGVIGISLGLKSLDSFFERLDVRQQRSLERVSP